MSLQTSATSIPQNASAPAAHTRIADAPSAAQIKAPEEHDLYQVFPPIDTISFRQNKGCDARLGLSSKINLVAKLGCRRSPPPIP